MQDMQDLCKNLAQILHAKLARFADSTARACKILAEILLRARKMSVFLHVSCKFLQESCNPLLQDLASNFQTCKKPCTVDFLQENVQDFNSRENDILARLWTLFLQDYGHFSCMIMDNFLARLRAVCLQDKWQFSCKYINSHLACRFPLQKLIFPSNKYIIIIQMHQT